MCTVAETFLSHYLTDLLYAVLDTFLTLFCCLMMQIIKPKKRSPRWISTSVLDGPSELKDYSSAEYHVNNLLSPVRFQVRCTKLCFVSLNHMQATIRANLSIESKSTILLTFVHVSYISVGSTDIYS